MEKEFKRENGSRVLLRVSFWCNSMSNEFRWEASVKFKPKRVRDWRRTDTYRDDYTYRRANYEERRLIELRTVLMFVTEAELQAAFDEVWQTLKPDVSKMLEPKEVKE